MKLIIDDSELNEKPIVRLPLPEVIDGELVIPGKVVREKELGRPEGTSNKGQLEKELIALDSQNPNLTQKEIARVHGVSQTEVSFLSNGFDRSSIDTRKVNEGVKDVVSSAREKIASLATDKLMKTLETFVPETLDQKDKAGTALKLAGVLEKVSNGFQGNDANRPQFIVFSPRVRREDSYEVIDVSASEAS